MPTYMTIVTHISTMKVQKAYGFHRGIHFDFLALSVPQLYNFGQVIELL